MTRAFAVFPSVYTSKREMIACSAPSQPPLHHPQFDLRDQLQSDIRESACKNLRLLQLHSSGFDKMVVMMLFIVRIMMLLLMVMVTSAERIFSRMCIHTV